MPAVVGARIGPYEDLAAIGAGSMGAVWRARDTRLERDVALKVLPAATLTDATARAGLVREARLVSKLPHPHICTICDVGETEGQTHVAMELVEGQTLAERLRGGALRVGDAVRCGQQLPNALGHAHARGGVLPKVGPETSLLKAGSRLFLVSANCEATLACNCARSYGLSVALLADRIK